MPMKDASEYGRMSMQDSARASYLASRRPAVFESRKLTPGIASHAAISVVEEREDNKARSVASDDHAWNGVARSDLRFGRKRGEKKRKDRGAMKGEERGAR
jgi:hypothetical protein